MTREPYDYASGNPLNCNDELNPGSCLGDLGGFFVGAASAAGAPVGAHWLDHGFSGLQQYHHHIRADVGLHPPVPNQARPTDVDPNLRPKKVVLKDSLRLQRYFDELGRSITPEDPGPVGPSGNCGRYCKGLIAATIGGTADLLSQGFTNTEGPADRPGGPQ